MAARRERARIRTGEHPQRARASAHLVRVPRSESAARRSAHPPSRCIQSLLCPLRTSASARAYEEMSEAADAAEGTELQPAAGVPVPAAAPTVSVECGERRGAPALARSEHGETHRCSPRAHPISGGGERLLERSARALG
jgi:hypothetical protein